MKQVKDRYFYKIWALYIFLFSFGIHLNAKGRNFIGQNYSPIGTTSQKCYKTTAELVYELSNIVDVAPMALAKQLSDAGYHVEYLAGQPYWVMYERA